MAFRDEPPEPDDGDAVLVLAAQRSKAEFAPLYRRYVELVYAYCARRLSDQTRAEDATSIVFTKAFAALRQFDPDKGTFRSWLFTIAHNVVVSEYRSTRITTPLQSVGAYHAFGPGPEDWALANERDLALRESIAQLPADQRDVLELRLIGLTGAEIASVLGRSHSAVKVAQHRALKRLRAALLAREQQEEDCHAR
jgi:RNA polymerase sigma-70 factor (ECF subfamily)